MVLSHSTLIYRLLIAALYFNIQIASAVYSLVFRGAASLKYIYNTCGVYEVKCLTCDQVYVGKTGRNFKTRYEEHSNDIRLNKDESKYSVHVLQENHEYGPTDKTMEILKVANKGKYLDIWERFYIYIRHLGLNMF
jgi:hypothetical protein